jgi:catechol 2,3-dioxygenase-like lactoylglutathione lyase family enzyme
MLSNSRLQSIILTSRICDAERFYSDVLGLSLRGRSKGALVYDVGGSDLRVSSVPVTRPSEHTGVGFAVDELAAVLTELANRAIAWERFPGFPHDERGAVITPDGDRVVWLRDPDGNLISIVEFSKR